MVWTNSTLLTLLGEAAHETSRKSDSARAIFAARAVFFIYSPATLKPKPHPTDGR
jgi:hypothetical protein